MNKAICFLLVCFGFCNAAQTSEYVVDYKTTRQIPKLFYVGTQFDSNTIFVNEEMGSDAYLTKDGGRTWNQLYVKKNGIRRNEIDEVTLKQWFFGHVLIYDDQFYCNESNNVWKPTEMYSIVLRGQDGMRLIRVKGEKNYLVEKTSDGGKTWAGVKGLPVLFHSFNSFDIVNENLIFALVNRKENDRFTYDLVCSYNGGKTWKTVCVPSETFDFSATRLFFLNTNTGWISSVRDDGLFRTDDGGQTWKRILIPERIASDIFFKDLKTGRIIGGVSKNIYETNDGGITWRKLTDHEIIDEKFLTFFGSARLSRWNDFAILRTLTMSEKFFKSVKLVHLE